MGHLDRGQLANADEGFIFLFRFTIGNDYSGFLLIIVFELNDTPDASAQKAIECFRVFLGNRHTAKTQIRESGLVVIVF